MNIGDIFMLLRADGSVLDSDIQLAATHAGDTGGQTFVQHFGGALKAGAAVLGIAFGAITQEMSNVEADFVARTGRTTDQAAAWGRDLNAIAGSSAQSFTDLASAGTEVQKMFQGTADDTRALTLDIRDFNTATGTDMVQAADSGAKAIAAWGLTSAAIPGLLDKATFASQNYKVSAGDMLDAIGRLAPAFQGLGLNADQAAGFIALASSAGVDAETMVRGLGGAIKKLPPGTTLTDYLTSLGAITDDAERARQATLLLGPALGPKLAQMVGPGRQSLDQIVASLNNTAGATTTAADAIDATWGHKFDVLMNGAKAAVRGLGDEFGGTGSLLTGIALAGPLILKLGAAAGGLYGAAVIAGGNLMAGLQLIWGEAAAAPGVIGAIKAGGTAAGTLYGSSFGGAFEIAALIAIPVAVMGVLKAGSNIVQEWISKNLGGNGRSTQDFADTLGARMDAMKEIVAKGGAAAGTRFNEEFQKQWDAGASTEDAIAAAKGAAFGTIIGQNAGSTAAAAFAATQQQRIMDFLGVLSAAAAAKTAPAIASMDQISSNLEDLQSQYQGLPGPVQTVWQDIDATTKAAAAAMALSDAKIAADAKTARDNAVAYLANIPVFAARKFAGGLPLIVAAIAAYQLAITEPVKKAKQIAAIDAELTSKEIKNGLKSHNPQIRKDTQDLVAWLKAKRDELNGKVTFTGVVTAGISHAPRTTGGTGGGTGVGARAAGGPVGPGWLGWVGENGPELLAMGSQGGTILSSLRSRMLAGVSAGLTTGLTMPRLAGAFGGAGSESLGAIAGGGVTNTYNVNVAGLIKAETPEDIGRALRRVGALGLS